MAKPINKFLHFFKNPKYSLHGKFFFLVAITLVITVLTTALLSYSISNWILSTSLSLIIAIIVFWYFSRFFFKPIQEIIQTLNDGISSFKDNDFSINIAKTRNDELGQLIDAYNRLTNVLREERLQLFQRELLLDTVIQATPISLLLTNIRDTVIYSNLAARKLFGNKNLEGLKLDEIVLSLPESLSAATLKKQEGLFTIENPQEQEIFHLSCRQFMLNNQAHYLYLYKKLTREINRQEVATWKKVIRLISHELNNSLAPISSLTSSGKQILTMNNRTEMLPDILDTISERTQHLHLFIEKYAQFARLPKPTPKAVKWQPFITKLQTLCDFQLVNTLPIEDAIFDPVQIEQALINLIKNAHESGSPKDGINLDIKQDKQRAIISVLDRGTGLKAEQLQQALLPFYSTKQSGTGLGLPLCREIIEAHGGTLKLSNREDGGFLACCTIPLNPSQ